MNLIFNVLVTCCLLQTSILFAEDNTSKTIQYENQKQEVFNLENFLKETTMVDKEITDTCHRKVPYKVNECKDVTKKKKVCEDVPAHQECKQVNNPICHSETTMENECHNLPGSQSCTQVPHQVCENQNTSQQQCRTVTEQQCHYETKYDNQCRNVPGEQECNVVVHYRQECSSQPGGQQCRTVPGDVQCSVINGENRCTKIPPHQECSDAPPRQECRQVPYEERECHQGPSRQECNQVPRQEQVCENVSRQQCDQVPHSEQVCHTEYQQQCSTTPGDEVCEDVPVEHQVCKDNYSQKCTDVPTKNVCKDVPYTENVCKDVTKYKNEDYECKKTIQVPVEKLLKTHKASVTVEFNVLSEILGPEFAVGLDENGKLALAATANDGEYGSDDSRAAVFVKKDVQAKDDGTVNTITADYKVTMLNANKQLAYLSTNDIYGTLKKYSLSFKLKGQIDSKRAALGVKIMRNKIVEIDKAAVNKGNISYAYNSADNTTMVTVDLQGEGAKIGSILTTDKTQYDTTITFSQNYTDIGDMILGRVQNFTWTMNRVLLITK
ncbi:MAG: hypothetical protein H7177_14700 [Rhizobacter sp.]|nr:hypothetical protein [Bacteriovorax sp.]